VQIIATVLLIDRVVFGTMTLWLAVERGRVGPRWFILGALLGPVALITVGFSERVPRGSFKACIECREPIPHEATTCPKCQTDLIEAEGAERRSRLSRG
jgi:hypothetical protein